MVAEVFKLPPIPENRDAEQSVLGGLMLDPDSWGKLQGKIEENDFFYSDHREIYQSMTKNIAEEKPLDPVTIADKMGGDLFTYVLELANNVPSAANIEAYADIVKTMSQKRRLCGIFADGRQLINDGMQPQDVILKIMEEVEGVAHERMGTSKDFRQILSAGLDAVEEARKLRKTGAVTGVPTGIPMLDQMLSGLRKSKLVIVAARPSVGKTALANQIGLHGAKTGHNVGILSLEMSDEELAHRAFAHEYQINGTALSYGDDRTVSELMGKVAARNIKNYPVFVDTDTYTLSGCVARANEWHRKHKLDLLIVDHIGLVEVEAANRNEGVGAVTRTLKKLSKKLDIPIIAVSQLNRESEKLKRKPLLSDLRDSGNIEQDCDIAIFLHTDEANQGKETLPIEIGILKHRGGRKGWLPPVFSFVGSTQTIRELANA